MVQFPQERQDSVDRMLSLIKFDLLDQEEKRRLTFQCTEEFLVKSSYIYQKILETGNKTEKTAFC